MPTDHELNNYTFRETDSGELKIIHDTDGDVATYDPSTGTFTSDKPFATEGLSNKDAPESYRLYLEDSNTILGDPQRSGMDWLEYSDIGPLMEEIIVNQLPPTGSVIEAQGTIRMAVGDYPGDASNSTYNGIPLTSQCRIIGEVASHDEPGSTRFTIPTQEPGTRINFTGACFRTPDETNYQLIYPEVRNLQLLGPGAAVAGSVGFQGTEQSNTWDFINVERVIVNDCENPITFGAGYGVVRDCKFERYTGRSSFKDRHFIARCNFTPENDGGDVLLDDTDASQCEFDITGEASPGVIVQGEARIAGGKVRKNLGSAQSGTAFSLRGPVRIEGLRIKESPETDGGSPISFNKIFDIFQPTDVQLHGVRDFTTSANSVQINGNGGAEDIDMLGCYFPNGFNVTNNPARVSYNNTVFVSGSDPAGADYGPEHAGVRIVRTDNTSEWVVESDGSLNARQ